MARSFHKKVLLGKLRQDVRQATDREGGGCLLLEYQCTKTGRLVAEVFPEKHPYMRVPPMETPRAQPSRSMGMYPNGTPRLHGGCRNVGRIKALWRSKCAESRGNGAPQLAPSLRMCVRGV